MPIRRPPNEESRISTRREIVTRELVRELLETGATGAAIAPELGISESTVSYHRRRLGHNIDVRCNRRFDWEAVQRFYDAGHSITE